MANKTLGVSGVLYTDRRNFYIDPNTYASLYGAATPFLSDLWESYTKREGLSPDPTYKMFEHRAGWRQQYFDANGAASWDSGGTPTDTNTVTVDGATGIGASNSTIDSSLVDKEVEIWDSTGTTYRGNVFVQAVNSSTEIVIKAISNPASSSETIADIVDNDRLYVIGGNSAEGGESPDAASDELEVVWNSVFYQRTPLEITSDLRNADTRGENDELARLRMLKGQEHKVQLNRKLYRATRRGGIGGTAHGAGGGTDSFSDDHITDADSKRVRNTMGLAPAFRRYGRTSGDQQNVFSINKASSTFDDLLEYADKAYQYNPNGLMKTMYCGPDFYLWLQRVNSGIVGNIDGKQVPISMESDGQSTLGHEVSRLNLGGYTFMVKKDESLRHTPYAGWAHVVDPQHIGVVFYNFTMSSDGKTYGGNAYATNIKIDNNPLAQKDEYITAMGLKLKLMEAHSQWKLV